MQDKENFLFTLRVSAPRGASKESVRKTIQVLIGCSLADAESTVDNGVGDVEAAALAISLDILVQEGVAA